MSDCMNVKQRENIHQHPCDFKYSFNSRYHSTIQNTGLLKKTVVTLAQDTLLWSNGHMNLLPCLSQKPLYLAQFLQKHTDIILHYIFTSLFVHHLPLCSFFEKALRLRHCSTDQTHLNSDHISGLSWRWLG